MALSDKVNLQVKVAAYSSNYVQYAFKFISYENKTINLNDYRIVCYFNTFRSQNIFVQNRILAGYGYNGTSGSLDTVAGYVNQEFFTPEFPPKIYPTNKRYDKEVILPLTGNAAIISAGGWWENILYQISFNSGQYFISENIGYPSYLIGQLALSEGYTYLPVEQTTYTDNDSFILEYNDPTYGWIKVTEYSNSSTPDSGTGKYPYDTIFENQKAIGNVNRQFGWNTKYDHDGILATYDGYIDQANPTSAFSNVTSYSINGSGAGSPNTRIGLYKFATTALAEKIVSAAEFYVFQPSSNQVVTVDCRLNIVDYDGDASWNEMSGWDGTSGTIQSQFYIDAPYQFQNSYIAYNLDKNIVQGWQDSSATNFGLNLRYDSAIDKTGYNSPTMNTLENSAAYKPTMFVYSGPISAAGSRYIRWEGTTSNLWSDATNWEGNILPTAADYAVFDQSYYTNPCLLDIDDSIKNLLGTSALYTGSINFSSHELTFYETTSAIDFRNFNSNFNASSATFNFRGNVNFYTENGSTFHSFGTVNFYNGGSIYKAFRIKNANILNDSTLTIVDPMNNPLIIKESGSLTMTDGSTIFCSDNTNAGIEMWQNSILCSNGTINAVVAYKGDSTVTSRIYLKDLYFTLPSLYFSETIPTKAYTATFTSGVLDVRRYIVIDSDQYTSTRSLVIDMSNPDTDFIISQGISVSNNVGGYEHPWGTVGIVFPSKTINANIFSLTQLISGTSNAENCTVNVNDISIHPNNSYVYNTSAAPIMLPNIVSTGVAQYGIGLKYAIFNNVSANNAYVNFSTDTVELKSLNNISMTNISTITLNGVLMSAQNIDFAGISNAQKLTMTGVNWSANATNSLQANNVILSNSIASSATGYAIRSSDLGGNVNWFFDTIPAIILETSASPSHYSQTPISAYYSITDEGGFDANTIAVTNGFGTLLDVVSYSPTSASFMVVISGAQRCGQLEISAVDYSGNITEFISMPFSYDFTAPTATIESYSPATGVSDSFINLIVSAHDNCILSGSQQVFAATFNGQPAQVQSINYSDHQNATVTIKLSSSSPITNGDLYISATDAALNTSVIYSSAFTIATIAPQVTFQNNPSFKVGSTIILVSAVFEDAIGMSTTIPYSMKYNGLNIPFSTIYDSTTKVILSAVIPSSLGAGSISVTGFNTAGVSATGTETDYSFLPVIIFGDPVPSNISKTTITVPISAIGAFLDDANYYYIRLADTRMPISQPTSGFINILGYDFEYLSFSATVSSMSDLYGDLIISAGYR